MRKVFLPTSFAILLAAYFLAPNGWFRPPKTASAARVQVEEADPFNTDAARNYRQGQVKHWRMLVIQH